MSKLAGLQRALCELRQQRAQPQRQVGDDDEALAALARGAVGAVTLEASVTPLFLQSGEDQLRRNHQTAASRPRVRAPPQRAGHADFETTKLYLREAENLAHAFGRVFPPSRPLS